MIDSAAWGRVQSAWLLCGSTGAASALQLFLNAFDRVPPVVFLFAQHFDPRRQSQLGDLSSENPLFNLQLVQGHCHLAPGRVLVVPPGGQVRFGERGRVSSSDVGWDGPLTPNLSQLLRAFASAPLPEHGVIFLSGMGGDGVDALPGVARGQAHIWSQSSSSSICSALPDAARSTGYIQRSGTPEELARDILLRCF